MRIGLVPCRLKQKGEKLDHILRHFGEAGPVIQLYPAHQLVEAAEITAAAFSARAAATGLQQPVKQGGSHGSKMGMIVGIAEQVEQDGLEEGESCVLFDLWAGMVENPETLVEHKAPGRRC